MCTVTQLHGSCGYLENTEVFNVMLWGLCSEYLHMVVYKIKQCGLQRSAVKFGYGRSLSCNGFMHVISAVQTVGSRQ